MLSHRIGSAKSRVSIIVGRRLHCLGPTPYRAPFSPAVLPAGRVLRPILKLPHNRLTKPEATALGSRENIPSLVKPSDEAPPAALDHSWTDPMQVGGKTLVSRRRPPLNRG